MVLLEFMNLDINTIELLLVLIPLITAVLTGLGAYTIRWDEINEVLRAIIGFILGGITGGIIDFVIIVILTQICPLFQI